MQNQSAVLDLYEEVGANITSLIAGVARRTESQDLATAAAKLSRELSGAGIRAGDDWCRGVLETVRRGDLLTIELE